ncbi:DUF2752 domain-containing protein [Halocola ammonii]
MISKLETVRKWRVGLSGVLIAIPIVLLLMPADYFDSGESICLSHLMAGVDCYACGMTRSVMHLIHFDFATAWDFNPLGFVVLPLLMLYWLKLVLQGFGVRILKWF